MEKMRRKFGMFLEKNLSLSRTYSKYAKAKNMSYINMAVLETIYKYQGSCTQKLICEETYYPKQSVNLVIKSFLENGYIELQEVPSDRRIKYISLTEKGHEYVKEIILPLWEVVENVISRFGETQYEELVRLLDIYGRLYSEEVDTLIQEKHLE